MYSELLWLILTFGVGVLFTYIHLADSNSLSTLIKPISLKIWIPSMLMTIGAFVYMSIEWIWHEDPNPIVLGMYSLFFLGALLWAPMTADALHREEKTTSVLIALCLAAAGSLGLLTMACLHSQNALLVVSSAWFALHHVFVDAVWWYMRWHIHGSSKAMFTLDTSGEGKQYDNLDYI